MVSRFDKDDVVRVGDDVVLSRVVLPSYCKPNPEDIPENMPPIDVCCVPIALVATTIEGEEVLRWVDLQDLTRVDGQANDVSDRFISGTDRPLVVASYPEAGAAS